MLSRLEAQKRRALASGAVGLATVVCLFGHLGAIGLVGPDEPRYAWIARAMAQTGDWITPRLYGTPWFEKPILYYWTAALGFALHLPDEWAARLPSVLAALAATIAVAWLAHRHYSEGEYCPWSPALLAPLFFATSVAAIGFARAATPDMLFAGSITIAMACAATILQRGNALRGSDDGPAVPRSALGPTLLWGCSLGLAVLAKGPAAMILAGGAGGLWAIATGKWRAGIRLLHPFAIAAFCVVALPWYIVCARQNPDFIHVFIFQHNFERYLTPLFQHRQPFWFFIPITLLAVIPWLAFMIPAARDGIKLWRERGWRGSPAFFFACWAIFPILFFSFSQSKLPSYILPGIPALSLVLAFAAAKILHDNSKVNASIFGLLGVTWIGLGIGGILWSLRLPEGTGSVKHSILSCVVLAILGGIATVILARRHRRATIWISLALVCASVEMAGISILPKLDSVYSARPIGTMLQRDLRPDRLFEYRLPRAWQYGLAFYLGRSLPEWSAGDHAAALVLTTRTNCEELRRQGLTQTECTESRGPISIVPVLTRPGANTPATP